MFRPDQRASIKVKFVTLVSALTLYLASTHKLPTEVNYIIKKRKADRRSKVTNKYNSINLKIIHSNTDGYKSKKESITDIADNEKPDLFLLNDTNLKGNLKVKVPGYFSNTRVEFQL